MREAAQIIGKCPGPFQPGAAVLAITETGEGPAQQISLLTDGHSIEPMRKSNSAMTLAQRLLAREDVEEVPTRLEHSADFRERKVDILDILENLIGADDLE
jgi:hypothetical protein